MSQMNSYITQVHHQVHPNSFSIYAAVVIRRVIACFTSLRDA